MCHQTHQEGQQGVPGPHGLSVDPAAVLGEHVAKRASRLAMERWQDYWICASCAQVWQGAPDTGGCTARLLAQRVVVLEDDSALRVLGGLYDRACAERDAALDRVTLLEGLLRDLAGKGETMKAALFTGNDTDEAIACMEWDSAVEDAARATAAALDAR